jgi:hypothetical protein
MLELLRHCVFSEMESKPDIGGPGRHRMLEINTVASEHPRHPSAPWDESVTLHTFFDNLCIVNKKGLSRCVPST